MYMSPMQNRNLEQKDLKIMVTVSVIPTGTAPRRQITQAICAQTGYAYQSVYQSLRKENGGYVFRGYNCTFIYN